MGGGTRGNPGEPFGSAEADGASESATQNCGAIVGEAETGDVKQSMFPCIGECMPTNKNDPTYRAIMRDLVLAHFIVTNDLPHDFEDRVAEISRVLKMFLGQGE